MSRIGQSTEKMNKKISQSSKRSKMNQSRTTLKEFLKEDKTKKHKMLEQMAQKITLKEFRKKSRNEWNWTKRRQLNSRKRK